MSEGVHPVIYGETYYPETWVWFSIKWECYSFLVKYFLKSLYYGQSLPENHEASLRKEKKTKQNQISHECQHQLFFSVLKW